MKDKEKQIEEKQIEEMAKDLKDMASIVRLVLEERTDIGYIPDLAFPIAKKLLEYYQPKLPEDSVVLSYKEYERFKNIERNWESAVLTQRDLASKETAEKIFAEIIWYSVKRIGKTTGDSYYQISYDKLNELARKFNIKIKE